MNQKLQELADLGQSVWLDFIRRSFITSGEMQHWIDQGVRGMTSNPSIFDKAITGSDDYQEELRRLILEDLSAEDIYWTLVIEDIQSAADLLRPVFDQTQGGDGFVSVEVRPGLAHDTQATLTEVRRLWSQINRPNLMVKIPATEEGIPAIQQATAEGVNVNITLIFSRQRYAQVMEAYLRGLEQRIQTGQPVDRIASVASFFVSRVDTKVDKLLQEIIKQEGPQAELASRLLGKAGIANARLAHQQFREVFESDRFNKLKQQGARLQRPLWASTSTKNPAYSDIMYVEELIGPHTVNTLPKETLEAFLDHGKPQLTIEQDLDQDRADLESLAKLGISMKQVTQELEDEGVSAFEKSFQDLFKNISEKRQQELIPSTGAQHTMPSTVIDRWLEYSLPDPARVEAALEEMTRNDILTRIWNHDHTVWSPDPTEITNRLGWLTIADEMEMHIPQIEALVYAVTQAGYTNALLLGMGGSSLAPDLFSRTFPPNEGKDFPALRLEVLDSTDPGAVLAYTGKLDPAKTLFIVSTKSGTTEETLSFFKYFYNWTMAALGEENTGDHFIAITDPGSQLVDLAQRYHFRAAFLNDPNIGGRYSALSYFGLVPAALCGVDLPRLLDSARKMEEDCKPEVPVQDNPATRLGALLGELANAGQNKATFVLSPSIVSFGDWVEQLIAESTGKQGRGILPVVGEPLGPPAVYGSDRFFIYVSLFNDEDVHPALDNLQDSGFPVVRMVLQDIYDLGGQFFLWELATAIAGYCLGINPFNQPNVEAAKKLAREMVSTYKQTGSLPEDAPQLSLDGISVFGPQVVQGLGTEWNLQAKNPEEALGIFLTQSRPGDYIALQAFLNPTAATEGVLQDLRARLRDRYHLATTLGFGPRFLHSTGQEHKGDAGQGLFIQFTSRPAQDAPIPDQAGQASSSITFDVLMMAQALGDQKALQEAGRRVIRFDLSGSVDAGIQRLANSMI